VIVSALVASMLLRTALAGHDPVMHNAATESSRIDTLIASALCTVGGERRGGVPPDDRHPPPGERGASASCAHLASGIHGIKIAAFRRIACATLEPITSQARIDDPSVAPEWSSAHQPRGPPDACVHADAAGEFAGRIIVLRYVISATKGIAHEV
jgi:hypothetical protein